MMRLAKLASQKIYNVDLDAIKPTTNDSPKKRKKTFGAGNGKSLTQTYANSAVESNGDPKLLSSDGALLIRVNGDAGDQIDQAADLGKSFRERKVF